MWPNPTNPTVAPAKPLTQGSARLWAGEAHSPLAQRCVLAENPAAQQHRRGDDVLGDGILVVEGVRDLGALRQRVHFDLVRAGAGDLDQP